MLTEQTVLMVSTALTALTALTGQQALRVLPVPPVPPVSLADQDWRAVMVMTVGQSPALQEPPEQPVLPGLQGQLDLLESQVLMDLMVTTVGPYQEHLALLALLVPLVHQEPPEQLAFKESTVSTAPMVTTAGRSPV